MLFTTDQQTISDLNIFGKAGSDAVYALFNRTLTRGGAALLEEMFRYPLSDAGTINGRSRIIQYFSGDFVFPFDGGLLDVAENYLDNQDERTKISAEGDRLSARLSNLVLEDNNYKFVEKGVTALATILQNFRDFISQQAHDTQSPYHAETTVIVGILADEVFTDILQQRADRKMSYATLSAYDQLLRFSQRARIRQLLRYVYELDVYLAVGKIAATRGFTFARAGSSDLLVLEGVFHPGLTNAIPNSFSLHKDRNLVFLTGANMAGKSTFMKSLGIAMYLGHMGFPVPAARMEFSVTEGIYTTINLPDNLGMGSSHYYAEVLRVKKLARELQLGKRLFVIIDELFRGTNVKDAFEATVAITAMFASCRDSMFIISSHILEAGVVLQQRCPNIGFNYLPTRMEGNTPVYTRQLTTGITADRHGMIIINNEGIIEILSAGRRKAT